MQPIEAARALLALHPDAVVVSSCGYISRDLHSAGDRPANFYLVGSMGMAAPVALGIALVRPDLQVLALDGDGAVMMNAGALAMIGNQRPRNFTHAVLDNRAHESTGGQPTVRPESLIELALAMGYEEARRVDRLADLRPAQRRPAFLQVAVQPRAAVAPRVRIEPPEMVARFRQALQSERRR